MKYTVSLNNTKYVVEIEDSIATIVDKSADQNKLYPDTDSNDYYDVPDFDFSDNESENSTTLVAQLPGMVIQVCVGEGTTVKKGDVLLVIESMKMENEIVAEHDCKILEVSVKVGDYVKKDQPLLATEHIINEDKKE